MPEAPAEESSKKSQTTRSTESEVQRATNEQSRVAEVTKTVTSKINHEVVNVTRSKTSESQQKVQPPSYTEDKSCQPVNNPQWRATPEHFTQQPPSCRSREQSAFEWQARRTTFQQTRRRTWTTANQFTMLRTHRSDSRTGGERAARTVV